MPLASGEVFDNLRPEAIVDHAPKGPLTDAAGALVEAAGQRMSGAAPNVPSTADDIRRIGLRRS